MERRVARTRGTCKAHVIHAELKRFVRIFRDTYAEGRNKDRILRKFSENRLIDSQCMTEEEVINLY
jgi:hypothetical protein